MQVACNSCGAQYEFEASAIPAEGYDAQCTSCSAIFFVAPETSAAASEPPSDSPQVSVSCSHCGAVYQFAASDIPDGGYDAQCTQCQGVFFVSPQGAAPTGGFDTQTSPALMYSSSMTSATPDQATHTNIQAGHTPQAAEYKTGEIMTGEYMTDQTPASAPGFSPRPLDAGTMELHKPPEEAFDEVSGVMLVSDGNMGQSGVGTPAFAHNDHADNSDDTDAVAPQYDGDLGDPVRRWTASSNAAEVAADIDQEDDPGTRGRFNPLLKAMGAVAALALASGIAYTVVPAMKQRAEQPVPKAPSAAAQAAFVRGQKAMLEDTEAGYQSANAAFVEAVNMAPEYAEALTWQSVAHSLLGGDKIEAGRDALQDAHQKQAEAKAFARAAPQGKTRPRDLSEFTSHLQSLQHAAQSELQKATELLESGGKTLSEGEILLLRARRIAGDRATIAEAQAIWYVSQPAGSAAAVQELQHADALRTDAGHAVQDATPWWHAVAQARLAAAERATQPQAVAGLMALSKQEPQVVRARWELADLLAHTAKKNEAREVAQAIVAKVPTHAKAQSLLAQLQPQAEDKSAASTAPSEPVADTPAKPERPGKGKRHRARKK